MADSIFYEVHVKGFTKLHPDVPEALRGTYAGLAHPAAVVAPRSDSVSPRSNCCPCTSSCTTPSSSRAGCATTGATSRSATSRRTTVLASGESGGQVDEFRQMVRALHAAGLEVILDVVFNHTAEGDEWGPTLCFRGIDNAAYYRLEEDRARYVDDTGCGNTVDLHQPQALRLVMDCAALLGAGDARGRLPLRPGG